MREVEVTRFTLALMILAGFVAGCEIGAVQSTEEVTQEVTPMLEATKVIPVTPESIPIPSSGED